MTKTIEDLFVFLQFCTDLLFVIFFFIFYNKTKTRKDLVAILLYCSLDLVINFITVIIDKDLASYQFISLLYSFFTLFEYATFAFILWFNIHKPLFRKLIIILSILFSLFLIIYNLTTKVVNLDSIPIGFETILILFYSFYYLFEQTNDTTNLFIYTKYQFWIITGIMIYLSGSFFIYIFANQIDLKLLKQYWFLTYAFYVLKNIFFVVALFVYVKSQKKLHPKKLQPYLH